MNFSSCSITCFGTTITSNLSFSSFSTIQSAVSSLTSTLLLQQASIFYCWHHCHDSATLLLRPKPSASFFHNIKLHTNSVQLDILWKHLTVASLFFRICFGDWRLNPTSILTVRRPYFRELNTLPCLIDSN